MYVGYYQFLHGWQHHHYYGALSAQGTADQSIIFTSNAEVPAAGDWKGLYFRDQTNGSLTRVEHSIVEYSGHTNNANIYLANANPTIQYTTLRNSSHSGIYVNNTGSNGATLNCNNFKDNVYGIYTTNNAQPTITGNNFLRNQSAGVYNAHTLTVTAANNWWDDANGPGYNGDDFVGIVNAVPWLTEASTCINTPPTNTPPFTPKTPTPANNAVRIPVTSEGSPIDITLSWVGGDPNPWDTVVYDVYLGTAADSLTKTGDGLAAVPYAASGLAGGTTYYWQVVARDNTGAETAGPVWQFTTLGDPPDLTVTDITWEPATDIAPDTGVIFTATVENIGTGPVVDMFTVTFRLDGNFLGSQTVQPVMDTGATLQFQLAWTATVGNHAIAVEVDSGSAVTEAFEDNNVLSKDMPEILDTTPPVLSASSPTDNAILQQVDAISATLSDAHGTIDDAAVIAGFSVSLGGQPVAGNVAESGDVFTFTPAAALTDGLYQVSVTAVDIAGNSQVYTFAFILDGQPPAAPTITGGTTLSGTIAVRPATNQSSATSVTLTGTREDNTAIWINGVERAVAGSGDWTVVLALQQGDNALEISARDTAGNASDSVWVDIFVDSTAPAIGAMTPADGSFVNAAPAQVTVAYGETGSGLDLAQSTLLVRDNAFTAITGNWTEQGGDTLLFTPTVALVDSIYTVTVQLKDNFGNQSAVLQYHFSLDTAPPDAPVVNPVTSPTHSLSQTITGTRNAFDALLVNDQEILGHTAETSWSHAATLVSGDNTFVFKTRDRADNQSDPVTVTIVYDDVAPLTVDTLSVNGASDGTRAILNWTGYDESTHGDIAAYRIYQAESSFDDVSGLTALGTVPAGQFAYTATGMTRGQTYWFAVVAVDTIGNARSAVTAVSAVITDILPPEDAVNLTVTSFGDRLVFNWQASPDSMGDLAGYVAYFDGAATGVDLLANQSSYERPGLAAATAYTLRLTSKDNDGNESIGTSVTGHTWLANPAGLAADPYSGYVDLTWNPAVPAEYLDHYAVYVSESDFSDTTGLTPALTTTGTAIKVAGLTNNTPYYFAVAAVNLSGGQSPAVTTVTATPAPDSAGPTITDIRADNLPFASGQTLDKPVLFAVMAEDPAGVSRVEFFIDGQPVHTDYNAVYSFFWNVVAATDGAHTLTVKLYDTLDNSTTVDYGVTVALGLPQAPTISSPAAGTVFNKADITVSGHGDKYSQIQMFVNGTPAGDPTDVDGAGNFAIPVTLVEGTNTLTATAANRAGTGPESAAVAVSLDTTIPTAPTGLAAQAKAAGAVRLTWQPTTGIEISGFNLYRANTDFIDPAAAIKLNTALLTATTYDDLPPEDGTWYYRVTAETGAGNESDLSEPASVNSDSTGPRASAIVYTPQGAYDATSGRMGPGRVDVTLSLNEPLQTAPFLSITPEGGSPISVELTKTSDLVYTGFFTIDESAPTGTAYAIFSARDVAGNRGTEVDSGASILIDTAGPAVARLIVQPAVPIRTDQAAPATITVTLGIDGAVKPGTTPVLTYKLSGEGRTDIAVDTLTRIETQSGDAETWQAVFDLVADAGLSGPESFSFGWQALDDLDNVGTRIQGLNLFQVYQGDLPPLDVPSGVAGLALSGGRAQITWEAVDEAAGYEIFRQAPGETEPTAWARPGNVTEFIDTPDADGIYAYAVASIRTENEQEAVSGLSTVVTVTVDSVAPVAPENLTLELVANGIKAAWDAPAQSETVTYALYRSDVQILTTVDGLTAYIPGIPHSTEENLVIDPTPSLTDYYYAVAAVDAAGNVSAPSNSEHLNVDLLPVSSLMVTQIDTDAPVVAWTHPGGAIAGFNLAIDAVQVNATPLSEQSYIDTGYAGDTRAYTLTAVDSGNVESLARTITLPQLAATVQPDQQVKRGVMNRLEYTVTNSGTAAVDNIQLKVRLNGKDHISETFSLQPSAFSLIPVIVGGYSDLPDVADLQTTIEVTPQSTETVRVVRNGTIPVGDGMLVLQILNEEFTRGASGTVRFTLENTGEEEIEIITARSSGNAASHQVTLYLEDADGNVIATAPFRQFVGAAIAALSNGNLVARIPAGETFTSDPLSISVPGNAPDTVTARLVIDKIYYHHNRSDQVEMNGLASNYDVTLIETTYFGEVTVIVPAVSTGDEDIVISGRAVSRATGDPLANAALNLVVTTSGFERSYDVYTSADGTFSHTFTPQAGEAGMYTVRAVHPDLTDRPVHGTFTINNVAVTPGAVNLNIPKNYEQQVRIQVTTGDGTPVTNLRLETVGTVPEGLHYTAGTAIASLAARQTGYLDFNLWADNTAGTTESFTLAVKSDEPGGDPWALVSVNAQFSEAKPVLYFTPNHVETGVAQTQSVTETVVLENRGLETMNGVNLVLLNDDASPAPAWAQLNAAAGQGDIVVGDTRDVGLTFTPADTVTPGTYAFRLRVSADNYPATDILTYVSVVADGIGSALFKVSDIYTGTTDSGGAIIQGLSGSKIWLQNEDVLTEEYTLHTDSLGEALFADLPAGRYKFRATATNHQEKIGRLWVKPGLTATEEVFLDYNLVTVEWSVSEITIEDKYEIILTAVYETDVPAAVVVASPTSITLPTMKAGDVYNGEFTLTNHGLIRADNIELGLPADDANFTYELPDGLPTSIAAKSSVTIAYRVTCVSPLEPDGTGTGGGCQTYGSCITIGYQYQCTNGVLSKNAINYCMTSQYGCTGGGGAPPTVSTGGGTWNYGSSSGSGSTSAPAPAPAQIEGVKCFPQPERKEKFCVSCWLKDTAKNIMQPVGSAVNTYMREYTRDSRDLTVKVPGGSVSIQRWYYGNRWYFEHERQRLQFNLGSQNGAIESIDKGGVIYEAAGTGIFVHETYRIAKQADDTWRWEDTYGAWKAFAADGRMTAFGNRSGTIANLVYTGEELTGYTNRNGDQVLWLEYDGDRISAATDVENRRVSYGYTDGQLTTVTDVRGHDATFEYDSEGRMKCTVDVGGNERHITYDSYGNVASVLDADGVGHQFEFDFDTGKEETYARITSTSGMLKEVWYDRDGDTRKVVVNGRAVQKIDKDGRAHILTDEAGLVTRKEYDEWDNLTRTVYPDGTETSAQYEHTFNRKIQETDENGVVTAYEYDASGHLVKKTDAQGSDVERVTEYEYDHDGHLLVTRRLGVGDTLTAETVMTYDAVGNLATVTDAENNITRFTSHDVMGNVLTKEDARGKTWTYEYDETGNLTKVTDPLLNVTQLFYDNLGNKVREVDAENREKLFEYDGHNNLVKVTDASLKETLFEYNSDNKLVKQTDPEGKVKIFVYDNEGRLLKSVDGNGNEVSIEYTEGTGCSSCSGGAATNQPERVIYPTFEKSFTYDQRGRKLTEADHLGADGSTLTAFVYDNVGNLVVKNDRETKAKDYAYDDLNRLQTVTDAIGGQTIYGYDVRDNLVSLTDAETNTTRFEYDRNNRLVKEVRPMGQETVYTYDAAGNLTEKLDAKGQKAVYSYDDAGRLETIQYFAATDLVNPVKTVAFTYDKVGNLKSYDDGTTTGTFGYDENHRKVTDTVDYGDFSLTNTYAYYANGLKKTYTGPDNVPYGYTYDPNNQLTGVTIPGQGMITINAYTWNRPAAMTLPGGATKTFAYDPLMRVKQILSKDPGGNALVDYNYNYDKMDNITAKNAEHGGYGYQYDDLYRLTNTDNPATTDEAFTYDKVGNRLTDAATTGNWNYNRNNELGGYDSTTFEYDVNGNMTKKTVDGVVTSSVYNMVDRLAEIWNGEAGSGSLTATYYHDPFGRRLWKDVGGVRTYFHYADEGLVGEYDAGGVEIKTYGYKPGSTWTTDPLFMKVGSSYYFYHNDHMGTPQKMTSANGAVVWSAKYESFGQAVVEVGTVVNNFRFPGQYFDTESGLNYNYHRYYDSELGRYLRRDPIGIGGGINLFNYVSMDPINKSDIMGLCPCNSDCKTGMYSFTGVEYGGFAVVAGITTRNLNVACSDASSSFNMQLSCLNFGGGAGGGVQFPTGVVNACSKEEAKDKLSGWGVFFNLLPIQLPPSFGLGIGFDKSTTNESFSGSPGVGLEVSAGGSYCWLGDKAPWIIF